MAITNSNAGPNTKDAGAVSEARRLLKSEDFFRDLLEALEKHGLVGEERNALALFVIVVSRFFLRPLSAVIRGASSTGKNFLAKCILALLTRDMVRELTSASAKSWFYSKEDFRHRVVYVQERNDESGSAQPLRALISEGKLIHWTLEYVDGVRTLVKKEVEGPVSGLSTTNGGLQIDDETRNLSIWVDESREQTARITAAYHRRGRGLDDLEKEAWWEVQRILEARAKALGDGCDIEFPDWFDEVAGRTYDRDTSVRRYYPAFVEGVRAVCLLRSFQDGRKSTDKRLVINFVDFAIASIILEQIFAESLRGQEGSALEVAEAVRAISQRRDGEPALTTDIAKELGIRQPRVYKRIDSAVKARAIESVGEPQKANVKRYLAKPKPRFTPDPEEVFLRVKALGDSLRFVHPLTGEPVTFKRMNSKGKVA